jgi:hypothetical protein
MPREPRSMTDELTQEGGNDHTLEHLSSLHVPPSKRVAVRSTDLPYGHLRLERASELRGGSNADHKDQFTSELEEQPLRHAMLQRLDA